MAIEYLGLSEINGPLVVLEGVKNASFEEIVEFRMEDGTEKIGRIVEIYEDKAVIQVFEGTDNMSLGNTHTRLTGHPMEIGLSPEILGRTFNGIGQPIDGLGDITPEVSLNTVSYTHLDVYKRQAVRHNIRFYFSKNNVENQPFSRIYQAHNHNGKHGGKKKRLLCCLTAFLCTFSSESLSSHNCATCCQRCKNINKKHHNGCLLYTS